MNAVQAVTAPDRRISKVELYASEILPEDSPVLRTLPAGIDPARFKNSLHIALMMNPTLLNCDARLTFREVARAANYGLSLDPSMGEAWLIVRKRDGRPEPQMQLGYRGKMRLARQSGEVARIVAYPVTAKMVSEGRFKVTLREVFYEPDVFNDDSDVVGYFAYVEYKDGSEDHETMSLREIYKIRDRSDGWKAFKKGSIKSTPWHDFEGEMCKKTVLSRLLKRVPMSADLVEFLRKDEVADYADAEEAPSPAGAPTPALAPPRRGRPPGSRTAALQEIAGIGPVPAPKAPKNKPATGPDESGTEEEQPSASVDIPDDPQEGDPEIREPDNGPDESFVVDTTSPEYGRGMRDFHAGLKRCVKREILENPEKLSNWQAGWDDARDGVDEATNGREDT